MGYDFDDFDEDVKTAVFYAESGEYDRAMRTLGAACKRYGKDPDSAERECKQALRQRPAYPFWEGYCDAEKKR